MSSMDMLDVGQANEFKLACRRNGFTPQDLKWLCEGDMLSQLLKVRAGQAVIDVPVIDCDADPIEQGDCKVIAHQKSGLLKWDASIIDQFIRNAGRKDSCEVPFNANVCIFLLHNRQFVPARWMGKSIHFAGTRYGSVHSNQSFIFSLYPNDQGWSWLNRIWHIPKDDSPSP